MIRNPDVQFQNENVQEFETERARLRNFYSQDLRSDFLSYLHLSIATLLGDYGLTDEEITSEVSGVVGDVNPEFFLVTEDDVPKIFLFRFVEGTLSKREQKRHLTSMIEGLLDLAEKKTSRNIFDATARDRYLEMKVVKKSDPEFHFFLITMDTKEIELLDFPSLRFTGLRSGVDTVTVHSVETILNKFQSDVLSVQTNTIFHGDKNKCYSYLGDSQHRVVSLLLPASEYVRSTYSLGVNLFRLNPRLFLSKSAGPNKNMLETLQSPEAKYFHLFNNGITGVCKSLSTKISGATIQVEATDLQIVNGCQTTETIWALARKNLELTDVMIPLRLVEVGDDEDLSRRISMTTNSQSAIAAADLVANDSIQTTIKRALADYNIFYESRRGEWRKISHADRIKLQRNSFDWCNEGIAKINLREMGQVLLSVCGKPNQAKEQIAGLFKIQNQGLYRELFVDSWHDPSQIAFVSLLYIYLRDTKRWLTPTADKGIVTLAGLGRFYIVYLIYELWRKGEDAFWGTVSERKEGQDSLVDADSSAEWFEQFNEEEVSELANLAVMALDLVLKDSEGQIDGNRALLRQGIHKTMIEDKFLELLSR